MCCQGKLKLTCTCKYGSFTAPLLLTPSLPSPPTGLCGPRHEIHVGIHVGPVALLVLLPAPARALLVRPDLLRLAPITAPSRCPISSPTTPSRTRHLLFRLLRLLRRRRLRLEPRALVLVRGLPVQPLAVRDLLLPSLDLLSFTHTPSSTLAPQPKQCTAKARNPLHVRSA